MDVSSSLACFMSQIVDFPALLLKLTFLCFHVQIDYQGTLRPAENFDAADDAVKLKNAMKGLGERFSLILWTG